MTMTSEYVDPGDFYLNVLNLTGADARGKMEYIERDGELLEAACSSCGTRSVLERIRGETRDLRCGCGTILRVLG